MSKLRTADEVAMLIEDGMTIGISLMAWPAGLKVAQAIERRFLETGHPRDLTIVSSSGAGDDKEYGVTRFGHEGMVKRWIAGIMRQAPNMGKLVQENKIESI